MGYASKAGRAKTSATNPQAHAICDRCGFRYNHVTLRWQYDWRGTSLQNIRLLVCDTCYDEPQNQLRAIVVPADPVPILNPRLQDFVNAETDNIFATAALATDPTTGIPVPDGSAITTQDGVNITTQPIGRSQGLDPNAIMPLNGTVIFDVHLGVTNVSADGTNTITVTCAIPHNLATNDQVAVTGTSINELMGFYSVTVVTDYVFTYDIVPFISSGNYATEYTIIATCSVGLPYGYEQIPILGIANGKGASTPYFWVNNLGQRIYFENDAGNILLWNFPQ
jgi:hypothetical protein